MSAFQHRYGCPNPFQVEVPAQLKYRHRCRNPRHGTEKRHPAPKKIPRPAAKDLALQQGQTLQARYFGNRIRCPVLYLFEKINSFQRDGFRRE